MREKLYKLERKLLYKELEPVFAKLSSVRYAVVKGEVLSQQIYGAPHKRMSSDIDILIDKKNVHLLEEQLLKLGFKQKSVENNAESRHARILCMAYSHQIPSYYKEMFGFYFNVDINYDIFWGEYEGTRCSIDDFLSDTVEMEIYGVKVKTLSLEKAFIQLILHHYKEVNSLYHLSHHNTIRTNIFSDINHFVMNHKDVLSVEIVKELSKIYFIGKYTYYMFYFTEKVFGQVCLSPYIHELRAYEDTDLLDCYGLCPAERKKWAISFEERLDNKNISEYIQKDLSSDDIQKIKLNSKIFL